MSRNVQADWNPDVHPRGPDGQFIDLLDLPETPHVEGTVEMDPWYRDRVGSYMAGSHLKVNKDIREGNLSDKSERIRESVQQGIDQAGSFDPITVYRGLEAPPDVADGFQEGEQVTLNGFQSASHDPDVASNFADSPDWAESREDVLLEITTDQGLPTYNIEDLGASEDEQELILGSGWEYEVQQVDDGGEVKRVALRLVRGDQDE